MDFEFLRNIEGGMDRGAVLEDLMQRYGGDVWRYAYFLTRRADLSDDIAQEAFMKIYENLYSYRSEAAVKTWILTITRNVTIDFWRTAWLRKVLPSSKPPERDSHPSAETEAMGRMDMDELWKIVLNLPKKLREPLVLYAHHQLSMTEIAEMLQLSPNTVKSRLFRARAKVTAQVSQRDAGQDSKGANDDETG